MDSFSTDALLLRNYDYGDGHRIISVYSRDRGKLKAVARGSRKIKSRFAAFLEPASVNTLTFHSKNKDSLYTLTSVRPVKTNERLRSDMKLFGYASLALEGTDIMTAEEDPEPEIFELIIKTLDDIGEKEAAATCWLYLFRLLKATGYRLELFRCQNCAAKIEGDGIFSYSSGGVVCRDCHNSPPYLKLSEAALKAIKGISETTSLSPEIEQEIGNLIQKYIKYEFNRDFKSTKFMDIFREKCIFRT